MITVNGWKPLTIITKSYILDVAAVLDPPLQLRFSTESEKLAHSKQSLKDKAV